MFSDLKFVFRLFRRTPTVAVIPLLTLALGIGASTAVFSVVNSILLKPLPYPNAARVVMVWLQAPKALNLGFDELPWGPNAFRQLQRETATLQNVAAFQGASFNLTGAGEPQLLDGFSVSAQFFSVLGVTPELGRAFTVTEDQPGRDHEVILGYNLWLTRFNKDPAIQGRSVELNGYQYTVIGVMPPGFTFPHASEMPGVFSFPREAQLWVPLAIPPVPPPFAPSELAVMGLLKQGVSLTQAQADLNVFAVREDREFPRAKGWFNSKATSLHQQVTGGTRRPLILLLLSVCLVLLIACSNVANLLLAQSIGRKTEFTLRAALGAGKLRLIRQLITESIFLASVGGITGICFALAGIRLVKLVAPSDIPRLSEVRLDSIASAFALLVTLVTGILFGLAPALNASKVSLVESLKEGGQRAGGSRGGSKFRNGFVIAEIAIALVLVISASLMVRTLSNLFNENPGFKPESVLTFELSLPGSKYRDNAHITDFYQRVLQQLQPLSGITAAGVAESVPMSGATESTVIRIPEHPTTGEKAHPVVDYTIASPGYFPAVGTPILRGRDFLASDTGDSAPVTVINQAMAKKFWPGEDPLGKQVVIPSAHAPLLVIGVLPDIRRTSMSKQTGPEMYVPFTQNPWPSMSVMQVLVRTKAAPMSMAGSVRNSIHSLDPQLPIAKVTTLTNIVSESMAQSRFSTVLVSSLGTLALILASIGMYGLISYSVIQRTQEIGVRMALGAQRRTVFQMILLSGAKIAGVGIGIGMLVALGVMQVMTRFLYGVKAIDPITFITVPLILFAVVIVACYVPAVRAMRIYPMRAIRYL